MATANGNASNSLKTKRSKLSLKSKKQLQEISPAPVPRSSHRIRTLSTESDDKKASFDRHCFVLFLPTFMYLYILSKYYIYIYIIAMYRVLHKTKPQENIC